MKAKASICISDDATLIESLEISKSRIQVMIDKGMDNEAEMLQGRHPPRGDLPPSRQALSCERYLVLCSKFKIITEDELGIK